jgi:hypothetical protein
MGLATVSVTVVTGRAARPAKKRSRKNPVQQQSVLKWRLFRDETLKKLSAIHDQMQRTWDADELAILEQQEINCLYLLDGAPRDPLQAPAEES